MRKLAAIALLMLTACGPVYETRYELTPPAQSQNSAACLAGCEVQRSACVQANDEQFSLCRSRAQLDAMQCRSWRRSSRYDRSPFPFGCDAPICWNNRGTCEAGFQACYTACGGTVTPQRVCVERCPEDAPAAPSTAGG